MPSIAIPPGFCQCGCGQPTTLATETNTREGRIKGQPLRYIHSHWHRRSRPAERIAGGYRIPLTRGASCTVSPNDTDLAQYSWSLDGPGNYASRRDYTVPTKPATFLMHRVILERMLGRALTSCEQVDHQNGNKLDNRRENLRLATPQQNSRNRGKNANNTSGYKGVSYSRCAHKWTAQIYINRKRQHLGVFTTPEAAAIAYNEAAEREFGGWNRESQAARQSRRDAY